MLQVGSRSFPASWSCRHPPKVCPLPTHASSSSTCPGTHQRRTWQLLSAEQFRSQRALVLARHCLCWSGTGSLELFIICLVADRGMNMLQHSFGWLPGCIANPSNPSLTTFMTAMKQREISGIYNAVASQQVWSHTEEDKVKFGRYQDSLEQTCKLACDLVQKRIA